MPKGICLASSATAISVSLCGFAAAQDVTATYSLYGTPGLLEMPTAQTAPEHELAGTFSYTDTVARTTLSFQLTRRLSGTFRYSFSDVFEDDTLATTDREFDRGFDLHYRFNNESTYVPAVAIGLRDMFSPGRFGGEYIVASKSVGNNLIATAGLGWGAFATEGGFDSPFGGDFDVRPDPEDPEGQLNNDQWFKGDAAFFGGLEYQINDQWGIKAEYSSNAFPEASGAVSLPVSSPYNYGLTYRPRDGVQLGLSYLYGEQVGFSGTFTLNASERPGLSGNDRAPAPVKVRAADARAAATWDRSAVPEAGLRNALEALLDLEGITFVGLEMTDRTARVRYINGRYRSNAQAVGRVARMMTQVMPGSIEVFILEPQRRGIALSATVIQRSDLEQLENRAGSSAAMLQRAEFQDADGNDGLTRVESDSPAFTWGLGPYFRINPFTSDGSADIDLGLSLSGTYRLRPNLVLSGSIEQNLLKPDDDPDTVDSTPDIQNVRSDGSRYGNDGVPVLSSLTLSHFARPGNDLYSRVSVGYLERMFGGISTELLWKRVDSNFGLGAELNYVAQRDSDMRFGFEEYDYQVTTGHVSAYYDLGNGYHTQLDVGQYLAGDLGATLSVDREFDNGVVIGGYFTRTDMSVDDFGSGSYNKGVKVTIPQDFFTGSPTRGTYGNTFRTRVGDGGARLQVTGRLYDTVRGAHEADMTDTWGRFWR